VICDGFILQKHKEPVGASNLAALLENSHRKTLLGITQVAMLGEMAVSQALDKVELKE